MYRLSVVIPARNERLRLPRTLAALDLLSDDWGLSTEVLICDDGSLDGTPQWAEDCTCGVTVRVLPLRQPTGVGTAVQAGMLAAQGERILLCDADGPVPFEDLEPLWRALDHGADLAAGSRQVDPLSVQRRQPWYRVLVGRAWSAVARSIAPTGVRDTQCGFKLFRRQCAHAVFARTLAKSFAFHVEALSLAKRLGFRTEEIAVRWQDQPGSKIRLWRDPGIMLWELLWVGWRHRTGRFDRRVAAPVLHRIEPRMRQNTPTARVGNDPRS